MSGWFQRWVQFCDRHERADVLALVRFGVGLTLLCDLLLAAALGLVPRLWGPLEEHGFGPTSYAHPGCLFYTWFGASTGSAWLLFAITCASAAGLCVGLFTRTSALVFVLSYAQLAQLSPSADRGIDALLRNVCLVLSCSGAGATASLDARIFHGRWLCDTRVPAWPRYLIILQLVIVYFQAGILKQSPQWTSLDDYSALYIVLRRPHFARFALSPALLTLAYPLLQLSTLATLLFERGALLIPVLLWLRETRARGGRLRALALRSRMLPLWVATGVTFHLALAVFLQLGIFPWGCLALYPALAHPDSLRAFVARLALAPTAARA